MGRIDRRRLMRKVKKFDRKTLVFSAFYFLLGSYLLLFSDYALGMLGLYVAALMILASHVLANHE